MKLDPEGVEKAAYEIFDKSGFHSRKFCDRLATAALTAYFDHLKESGKMRAAAAYEEKLQWIADTGPPLVPFADEFPALIIKQEE